MTYPELTEEYGHHAIAYFAGSNPVSLQKYHILFKIIVLVLIPWPYDFYFVIST